MYQRRENSVLPCCWIKGSITVCFYQKLNNYIFFFSFQHTQHFSSWVSLCLCKYLLLASSQSGQVNTWLRQVCVLDYLRVNSSIWSFRFWLWQMVLLQPCPYLLLMNNTFSLLSRHICPAAGLCISGVPENQNIMDWFQEHFCFRCSNCGWFSVYCCDFSNVRWYVDF